MMHTTICCECRKSLIGEQSFYGLHKNCFKKLFNLSEVSEFLDLIPRSQSQAPHQVQEENISFFHGAYRKYSGRLGETGFILKVQQKEYPELPSTEYLCNQIYEKLNIMVPDSYLIRFPDECFCFVTKNFMSGLMASDLVHIYHFLPKEEEYDCENLVAIIGEQTGRRTEQERFAYLTLADSIIGNHDRHGRNLGFIRSPAGMRLAPFYDNPSAIGLEDHFMLGADLQPRGSIFTKHTDKPTTKDYILEWKRLGYGDIVDQFRARYASINIRNLIENSYMSEKRQKALVRLIAGRSEELCAN